MAGDATSNGRWIGLGFNAARGFARTPDGPGRLSVVPDGDPTPPVIHSHYTWFQDPRTNEVASELVELLRNS